MSPAAKGRYAIGDFSSWSDACSYAAELVQQGMDPKGLGLLGKATQEPPRTNGLGSPHDFSLDDIGSGARLMCVGPALIGLLASQPGSRKPSFRGALERWLMPSHSTMLAEALDLGHVLLWVPLPTPEQECLICLGILRHTGRPLQIHDFN